MNAKALGMVFFMAVVLVCSTGCKTSSPKAWAWVGANGSIRDSGGQSTITVTRVGTGQYCIKTIPTVISSYKPVIATLQGIDLAPGFINANTGWGSVCNGYGDCGVFTADTTGLAADMSFTVVVP